MKVTEICSKTLLSSSQVYDYVINLYVGCQHACTYCYARFMKRFSGHKEPWGDFVDVKINAPDLLLNEIKRKKKGDVWVSGVCDPYQPLEEKVDYIIIDRMNYHYADSIYSKYGWVDKNIDDYFRIVGSKIKDECEKLRIDCRFVS